MMTGDSKGAENQFFLGVEHASKLVFWKGSSHRPGFLDALYIKGVVLGIKKDYYSAMECFKNILDKEHEHHEALFGLASAQSKQVLFGESAETFKRLISIVPDYADAWSEMGYALCEMEKFEEALEALDQALAIDPGNEKAVRYRETCICKVEGKE